MSVSITPQLSRLCRSARSLIAILVVMVFAVSPAHGSVAHASATTHPPLDSLDRRVATAKAYGSLPLSFIANAGQLDTTTHFQVRDRRGVLSFADSGVTLHLPTPTADIALTFDGANPHSTVDGADRLPGTANFIFGSDPAQWHTDVPTFGGIAYRDLYPGIDLHYTGHSGLLKGTYTVAAGVDPSIIHWRYAGIKAVHRDSTTTDLVITATDGSTLIEKAPIAWQTEHASIVPVAVGYQVVADGLISFAIADGTYDRSLPLIIDPGLDYSTYLGGSGNDQGTAIAVDSSGNAYISGLTTGSFGTGASFPASGSAYQGNNNGNFDAFVSKLNASGTALIYSTYLGGGGYDQANAIAVDTSGNATIAGYTYSNDFPVTANAYQKTENNSSVDGFVTKLNAAGSALIYSTYLGGSSFDAVNALAIDTAGNTYVTGVTTSTDFPVSSSAFQSGFGGGASDAFVARLNATGSALLYSTYLGGAGSEAGRGIAIDGAGIAYVTGLTTGMFKLTSGAYQTAFGGGTNDAFVSKLNATASALIYSTYLGGSGNDDGVAIAVDGNGNAIVAGDTSSSNYPTLGGSYQTVFGGGTNAFVTKLNAAGNGTLYSTYLGGNSDTQASALAIDPSGNAVIAGFTSGALPITAQAAQIALGGGGSDAFMARLNPMGSALTYSTYLGGAGLDFGSGVALDPSLNVYIVGQTSGGFPISTGAYATSYGGLSTDAFISKLTLPTSADLPRIDTIGIYRSGTFYLRLHNSQGFSDLNVTFNPSGQNLPIVGDWLGTGFDTIGVYDQTGGRFALCTVNVTANCASLANQIAFVLGNPNDTPLAGRWQNTAIHAGAGVYRATNGILYMKNALTTGFSDYNDVLGNPGDIGVAGDWTGKGFDSPGIYRPSLSTFFLSNQVTNGIVYSDLTATYGNSGDAPVVGDWIGQGHDGIGLFRQSVGYTYLRNSISTGAADNTFFYGTSGDVPVAGHWQVIYPPVPPPSNTTVKPLPTNSAGGSAPGSNQIGG